MNSLFYLVSMNCLEPYELDGHILSLRHSWILAVRKIHAISSKSIALEPRLTTCWVLGANLKMVIGQSQVNTLATIENLIQLMLC